MLRRNIRKKPAHNGTQTTRDSLNNAGPFDQTHDSQPQCHDADEPNAIVTAVFRAIERALGHIKRVVPAADGNREQNQRKPDVIQHT